MRIVIVVADSTIDPAYVLIFLATDGFSMMLDSFDEFRNQ
jgi:hypothetical protein